jgi:hypothetical protein
MTVLSLRRSGGELIAAKGLEMNYVHVQMEYLLIHCIRKITSSERNIHISC